MSDDDHSEAQLIEWAELAQTPRTQRCGNDWLASGCWWLFGIAFLAIWLGILWAFGII